MEQTERNFVTKNLFNKHEVPITCLAFTQLSLNVSGMPENQHIYAVVVN